MTDAVEFTLTAEETAVAASRAAWRASLQDGLLGRHLAPLAAFVLVVLFAAILGWTGLVARRSAEIGLILAAASYMGYRLWTRRRFLSARRSANAWADTLRQSAPLRVALDEDGFALQGRALAAQWRFADELEMEEVSGLVYVWPRDGFPLVWPLRAHPDPEAAADFLARARRRARVREPAELPDDDD
jgi:hypothetical protein